MDEQADEEEGADEEVYQQHCQTAPRGVCHRFVQQRIFEGRDGREAFMEALQRHNREG